MNFSKSNFVVKVNGELNFNSIQQKLKEENQFIPVGPFDENYTIEEIINNNLIGKYVDFFGQVKDWVLNVELENKSSNYILGADIVKNVSGYNLSRFIVGGEGDYGNIKNVTFRTLPILKMPKVGGQILNGVRIVCLLENQNKIKEFFQNEKLDFIHFNKIGVFDIESEIDLDGIEKLIVRKFLLKNGIPKLFPNTIIENEKLIKRIQSNF